MSELPVERFTPIESGRDSRHRPQRESRADAVFTDGGDMGALMRATNWSKTALGPVDEWPQSLRTTTSTCLNSRFPILVWWGPELVMLYNDAYRPILGDKHPDALGAAGQDVWPEVWEIIGPMLRGVLSRGEATWSEDQLLLLDRYGFREECYFTFSYSPVRDETGGVGGVFTAVTETTPRVVGERRMVTLRKLAERTASARAPSDAVTLTLRVFAENPDDMPFALLYLRDENAAAIVLANDDEAVPKAMRAPQQVPLSAEPNDEAWPISRVALRAKPERVAIPREPVADGDAGDVPWIEAVSEAYVLPVAHTGQDHPHGVLVVGINPRRPFDAEYRSFLELVSGHVATALVNAKAYEAERQRAEALAELDRAKTTFFSNVSHEFRTPLTLLLGPIEDAVARTSLDLATRRDLETAHRNGLRLLKLVNTLLDFSRIEAGRAEASYELLDVAAYTAELVSLFRSAFERAGIELRIDVPTVPAEAYIDRAMWEKIVLNLVSNAFKHTFAGEISLRVRAGDDRIALCVRDTGVGIPADELPRIFERFHRVPNARSRTYEGTGIGLALVQELVRLHGGEIVVESEEGVGTSFEVSLPQGTSHLPPDRIRAPRSQPPTGMGAAAYLEEALRWLPDDGSQAEDQSGASVAAASRGARILLADDNADMRDYVARLLRAHGWVVETVSDGAAALSAVTASPPDLLIADVMMPRLDGFGLLRAVRESPKTSGVPVVLLSARAGEESTADGLHAGADDYLVKPFSARELVARVSAHMGLSAARSRAAAQVDAALAATRLERQRLAELLRLAPAFIAVLRGPDHVFEMANDAYMRLVGFRDIVGKAARDALPEAEGQGYFELLDRVFETGVPFIGREMRLWLRPKPGAPLELHFVTFVYQAITEADGTRSGIFAHGVDVTEEVRARERIAASERQLQTLADAIPTLAWTARADGYIEWYNQQWYTYTGASPADMQGWGWQSVHDPAVLPSVMERWRGSIATGDSFEMIFPLRGAGGQYRHFLTRVAPLKDDVGNVLQWFGTNTDVEGERRERGRAERSVERVRQLQRLTEHLAATKTLDEVADVAVSEIVSATQAATGILALSNDSGTSATIVRQTGLPAAAQKLFAVISADQPGPVPECLRTRRAVFVEAFDGPQGLATRFPDLIAEFSEFGIGASATVPLEISGAVLGLMSYTFAQPRVFSDEDREFISALARQTTQAIERARLIESERQARQSAESANAAKTNFLAAMSHELRTPLNAIAGYADLLDMGVHGPVTDSQREALQRIQRNERHLLGLINDVLNFTKLEAGRLEYHISTLVLSDVVESIRPMIEPQLAKKALRYDVCIAADLLVRADREKVQQILLNLLSNACKFTPEGGRVLVDLDERAPEAEQVFLRVTDSGVGIPRDKQDAIFDPFVQVHRRLTQSTEGTGLGLAISRDLARAMMGDLRVSSVVGEGSRFTLTLPRERAS
jgi:signal transduction histidine kinase/CheY-like chemotaxis protein